MRLREMLKSKIDGVIITKTVLHYQGSIGIDSTLLEASNIVPAEKVHVLNYRNGMRFETYVIKEKKSSGTIGLYGPAVHCGSVGDKLCILSYTLVDEKELNKVKPKIIKVGKNNRLLK